MSSWHSSRRDSQRVLELQSSDSEDEKFAGQISLVRALTFKHCNRCVKCEHGCLNTDIEFRGCRTSP